MPGALLTRLYFAAAVASFCCSSAAPGAPARLPPCQALPCLMARIRRPCRRLLPLAPCRLHPRLNCRPPAPAPGPGLPAAGERTQGAVRLSISYKQFQEDEVDSGEHARLPSLHTVSQVALRIGRLSAQTSKHTGPGLRCAASAFRRPNGGSVAQPWPMLACLQPDRKTLNVSTALYADADHCWLPPSAPRHGAGHTLASNAARRPGLTPLSERSPAPRHPLQATAPPRRLLGWRCRPGRSPTSRRQQTPAPVPP